MRRRLSPFLGFLILVPIGILAGCRPRETQVEKGDRTQTLYLGNWGEPTDLDPQTATDLSTFAVVQALFEGLTQYDPKTSEPTPAAAASWDVSADNLTWTFHLRLEARWSNGDPVTASDFVFAYQRMLSPTFGAEYAYMLYPLKNAEAYNSGKIKDPNLIGARAADQHTLVLTLEHPVPYLLTMTCHSSWYPVHRATIEKFGPIDQRGSHWTLPGNLVGNGYFVLAEWRPHQYVRVTKSPTYWNRAQVRLNEVYFYPIEDEDAEEHAFRSGLLHVTYTLPTSKIAVYEKEHPELIHPAPFLATYFYRFNVTHPPLNDVRVRRALAMSIDRERIVKDVVRGGELPAGHLSPPDIAGFSATANVPTDVPAAQRLLAEAGYPGGKGFPHLDILINANQTHQQIAVAIQQMWRKELGIDVGVYSQEAKVWNDSMRRLDYQIARYAWIGDYLDPSTFLDLMASDSGNNQTGWKNAEYDRLIEKARITPDKAVRYACYQRCEQILAEECPLAPIYFYVRLNLIRPEVKGWYGNLLDEHPLLGVYLETSGAQTRR